MLLRSHLEKLLHVGLEPISALHHCMRDMRMMSIA